ncbi:hypothetical protein MJO29_012423 [Puccinia striiformis f. sp. tritici]|nr:hypothetical protein MJO29_012423 [Puccinia striiformis f. sp. tritici]KAI9606224.1 hypothetical protein H4Q26_004599 [Puccinia striiformis f. sp. tritici PST-130]
MSQPPLSPERQERLEEIKHLIARERLLIQESALLAYNGNPLVNDQLNILLDDNSINPLALYRLIRLINRKIVVEQGSNARKWPLPGSHMTPSMVAFFVDQPGSSSHLSVTTPSHHRAPAALSATPDAPAEIRAPPTQVQFNRSVRDSYFRRVRPRTRH